MCEMLLLDEQTHVVIVNWGKLYKKSVWDNVRFLNYVLKSVDQFVFSLWMDNCDSIFYRQTLI